MKPLHIAALLAAGAIGGALIMKVASKPQTTPPARVAAQVQTPPATAPETSATLPADASVTAVPPNPSPFVAAKPVRVARAPRTERRSAAIQPKSQTAAV